MAEKGFTILLDNSPNEGGKRDKQVQGGAAEKKSSSATPPPTQRSETASYEAPAAATANSMDEMFDLAKGWTGHPYLSPSLVSQFGEARAQQLVAKRSGSNKKAIDCSGFAQEVLGYAGIDPPEDQTAEGLFDHFKKNGTSLKAPQKGALVFFEPLKKEAQGSGKWDSGRNITHVAFASGDGKILDASGGRGVTERSLPPEGRFKYHYVMPKYKFGGNSV